MFFYFLESNLQKRYSLMSAATSFLDALTALACCLRLRAAKSLCLRAFGFAPAAFLPDLRFAFDDHCTSPLIFVSFRIYPLFFEN